LRQAVTGHPTYSGISGPNEQLRGKRDLQVLCRRFEEPEVQPGLNEGARILERDVLLVAATFLEVRGLDVARLLSHYAQEIRQILPRHTYARLELGIGHHRGGESDAVAAECDPFRFRIIESLRPAKSMLWSLQGPIVCQDIESSLRQSSR
jgi:hypothetical protein